MQRLLSSRLTLIIGLPCGALLALSLLGLALARLSPHPPFFVYLFAVIFAAWASGWEVAIVTLLLSNLVIDYFFLAPRFSLALGSDDLLWLLTFDLLGGLVIYVDAARRAADTRRAQAARELQAAYRRLDRLNGLLPECGVCKHLVDDPGYWADLEAYSMQKAIREKWVCPDCVARLYPEHGGHVT